VTTLHDAHREWAKRPADERFRSLTDLHAAVTTRRKQSQDGFLNMHDVTFDVNGDVRIKGTHGGDAKLTHWSLGQMLTKLGVPRELLTKLTPAVASAVLNDRLPKAIAEGDTDGRQRVLLHGDDDGKRTVRAFHGDTYGRVWDSDLTQTLLNYLPVGWRNPVAYEGGRWGAPLVPSGLYSGDRDMFVTFIDKGDMSDGTSFDVDGERFNRGFFAGNSETGSKSVFFTPFMFDYMCGNNYVWGAKEVTRFRTVHRGRAAQRGLYAFRTFLNYMNEQRNAGVEGFRAAVRAAKSEMAVPLKGASTTAKLECLDLAYAKFAKHFTKSEVTLALDAMLREEQSVTGTRYDWLAGFTAVARALPNADDRSKMETVASDLLLVPVK
jgi:hypothetical protein